MKQTNDLIIANHYINLHAEATNNNVKFCLTMEDVKNLLNQKTCYFTGVHFTENGEFVQCIDRLDNKKDFTTDNVVALTLSFGNKKNKLSIDDIEKLWNGVKHLKNVIEEKETKNIKDHNWIAIKNYPNYLINIYGEVKNKDTGKILTKSTGGYGYGLSSGGVARYFSTKFLLEQAFGTISLKHKDEFVSDAFVIKKKVIIAVKANRYVLISEDEHNYTVHKIKQGTVDVSSTIILQKRYSRFLGNKHVKYNAIKK